MSIKTRITIWYVSFFAVVICAVLVVLFSVGSYQTKRGVSVAVESAVESALHEIEYDDDDGELEIDDEIDFKSHGVYIAIYSENGALIAGGMPPELPADLSFDAEGGMRSVSADDTEWSVYDAEKHTEGGVVYLRGAASESEAESSISELIRIALIMLPFLLLVAALGGHIITKRAFMPVKSIVETAESIGESGDLSRRIGLPEGTDEIHMLANTFDSMFERLEEAFDKEKQFTADASHELRTPASVIISQSEYALEHPLESRAALGVILTQARKMSRLLSQLLLFARADRGTQLLTMERIDLSELTELVTEQQREYAIENGITIHTDLEPGICFTGDEVMLTRMLINLVENAVRYGRSGGNVWITLKESGHEITGSVRDDGIGISCESQRHVFERFYREDASRGGEGTGLGLSMVKWIVEAHGGRVIVQSEKGKGSCFIFVLNDCLQFEYK